MNKKKQRDAADKIEEMLPAVKEIVNQLRMGVSDNLAYALVYRLRRDIGYVVRELGAGVPSAEHDKKAEDIIEAQKWTN